MICESKNRIERERQMQFGGAIRGCSLRRHLDEHGNEESLFVWRACRRCNRKEIGHPLARMKDDGAGGGRVAFACDNFSSGGNPLRNFVTQTVTMIVNSSLVGGLRHGAALGDCGRILRR
jgi:hypothetical protein